MGKDEVYEEEQATSTTTRGVLPRGRIVAPDAGAAAGVREARLHPPDGGLWRPAELCERGADYERD